MSKLTSKSVLTAGQMRMPVIGLGTWLSTDEAVENAIDAALELGYRHIDTAFAYFNEAAIGRALNRWISSGRIKREELFIVTKLPSKAIQADLVEKLIKRSLEALQLDYLDLYLVHTPMGFKFDEEKTIFPKGEDGELIIDPNTDLIAVWKAMEEQVYAGRAKNIGVSNFNPEQISRILKNCRIPPANNQVELHVYLQQGEMLEFCKKHNITVCAYSSLGSPALADWKRKQGLPTEGSTIDLSPLQDPVVNEIAKRHGVSPGKILLRFVLQLGAAIIPKSTNPKRIKDNFDLFNFELSPAEMSQLKALDKGEMGRINDFKGSEKHHEYPFLRK